MYSKTRKTNKLGIFLLILVLSLIALPYLYWKYLNSPVDPNGQLQPFTVQQGISTDEIVQQLHEGGFIRSELAFKLWLKMTGMAGKLQAGDFQLSSAMNLEEVGNALSRAGSNDISVTLLEGWRKEEMAEKLNQVLGIDKAEFLKLVDEGYSFPDTYQFKKGATAAEVAQLLRQTFDQRYTPELQNKIKAKGLTPEEGVILASIIEREARSDEVRRQVASILLKRYNMDMALNADATIQYALGYQSAEKSWWKKVVLYQDLEINSPYNTYTHVGFPPSPIANPSLSSLNAVANADPSTPYVYYFHDSQGNSYYAKTLDEHNANVAAHR